jgi:Fe-S oxidoreductase
MGLIHLWARIASLAPGLANFLTQTPGLDILVKRLGGLAPERHMPAFARESFREWFARHEPLHPHGPGVLLFPDTFNNFFRPATAIAAVHVLEDAGWRVVVPSRLLCCARPLYDWGMLDRAKALVTELLDTLEPHLNRGLKVVGLEPACVSAFHDEVPALFPKDPRAAALKKQSMLFGEFIEAQNLPLPQLAGRALVQIHCHHHAVLQPDTEKKALARMGLDPQILPSGCCGMAGSFGFEAAKYEISTTIAGRALLPALEKAEPGTMLLADGFSCREQIEQLSGRKTLHLAEAIAAGLGFAPEAEIRRAPAVPQRLVVGGAMVLAGVLVGAAIGRGVASRR